LGTSDASFAMKSCGSNMKCMDVRMPSSAWMHENGHMCRAIPKAFTTFMGQAFTVGCLKPVMTLYFRLGKGKSCPSADLHYRLNPPTKVGGLSVFGAPLAQSWNICRLKSEALNQCVERQIEDAKLQFPIHPQRRCQSLTLTKLTY
jgi:hypothetical protein